MTTKPRPGAKIAKVDVEKLAVEYAAESKMVGSSAIRFIADEEEDLDYERDFPPTHCSCGRPQAFRLAEYRRRVKEKRPDQTLGDILDDMGIEPEKCITCRNYFINQFKFTSGTLNSGDATVLPSTETRPFPRRIEHNLPPDLYLESKEIAYYDKWAPVPVPQSQLVPQTLFTKEEKAQGKKPKMIPKPRVYHLTGYQAKSNFDTYLELYAVWGRPLGRLLPIWAEASYPEINFKGSKALIEAAFFQELCDVFTLSQAEGSIEERETTASDNLPRPSRKNLFDMQIEGNLDQYVEDRQNCYLFLRSNDKPAELQAAMIIPTTKRTLYFTFSEDLEESRLDFRDDFRFAGDSLTEIISGNTKTSETLLGKLFSWKDAQIYIRRENFLLPSESSVYRVIDRATKRLQREEKVRRKQEKAGDVESEFRDQETLDALILALNDNRNELEQIVHRLRTEKAEAQAEIDDLENNFIT